MMNPHIARDSNRGTITRIRLAGSSPKATLADMIVAAPRE